MTLRPARQGRFEKIHLGKFLGIFPKTKHLPDPVASDKYHVALQLIYPEGLQKVAGGHSFVSRNDHQNPADKAPHRETSHSLRGEIIAIPNNARGENQHEQT